MIEYAARVALLSFFLLVFAIILWFIFNAIAGLLNLPQMSYGKVAIVVAIVSVAAGSWNFNILRRTT
jgi:hypothetical protein